MSLICGVSCAKITNDYRPTLQVHDISYANNNNRIKNSELEKLVDGVELVTVTAEYCDDVDNCQEDIWFGTGFVYKKSSSFDYIMTAGHVAIPEKTIYNFQLNEIHTLKNFKIEIEDKNISLENVVGELNDKLDYAILKTKTTSKLKKINAVVGDSDSLECGDYLYTVGHPFAMGINYTDGILSAKEHIPPKYSEEETISEQFVFSTPISAGNSGSPIFAINEGRFYLVGVAVASYSGGQNLNIGVKINDILKNAAELMIEKE